MAKEINAQYSRYINASLRNNTLMISRALSRRLCFCSVSSFTAA